MPLRGVGARGYTWCCVCSGDLPPHTVLTTHLKRAHSMDLIPGCPKCPYYRQRGSDVEKHAARVHNIEGVSHKRGNDGFRWGLVRLQKSYADLCADMVVEYPRAEEELSTDQKEFLGQPATRVTPPSPRKSPRSTTRVKRGRSDSDTREPKESPRRHPPATEVQKSEVQKSPAPETTAEEPAVPLTRHLRWSLRQRQSNPEERSSEDDRWSLRQHQVKPEERASEGDSEDTIPLSTPPKTSTPRRRKSDSPGKVTETTPVLDEDSPASPESAAPRTPCHSVSLSDRSRSATYSFGEEPDKQIIHLSLSGDLNPVSLQTTATQTSAVETESSATQVPKVKTQDSVAQTELSLAATDSLLVLGAGSVVRLPQ